MPKRAGGEADLCRHTGNGQRTGPWGALLFRIAPLAFFFGSFYSVMGWFFVVLGFLVIGIGGFLGLYGRHLIQNQTPLTQQETRLPGLEPLQDKLLETIAHFQKELGEPKLVLARNGYLVRGDKKNTILGHVFGGALHSEAQEQAFEHLVESMPEVYLRRMPETRFDNPFVVTVTPEGMRYLRGR